MTSGGITGQISRPVLSDLDKTACILRIMGNMIANLMIRKFLIETKVQIYVKSALFPQSAILSFLQDQMCLIMFFDHVQNGEYVIDRHFEKYR